MQKIEKENPFYEEDLYKRYLSANSIETLTDEEQNWLEQHGAVRIGYLKKGMWVSVLRMQSQGNRQELLTIISVWLPIVWEKKCIEFQTTGFDSQEEELQALKDNRIDMIFPYEPESI